MAMGKMMKNGRLGLLTWIFLRGWTGLLLPTSLASAITLHQSRFQPSLCCYHLDRGLPRYCLRGWNRRLSLSPLLASKRPPELSSSSSSADGDTDTNTNTGGIRTPRQQKFNQKQKQKQPRPGSDTNTGGTGTPRQQNQNQKQKQPHPRPRPGPTERQLTSNATTSNTFSLATTATTTTTIGSNGHRPNQQQQIEKKASRRQQSLDVGNDALLSLNLNLDALAIAQAPGLAQELYRRIAALHQDGYYDTAPDVVSFNSVLKAWQHNPSKALEFWEQEMAKTEQQRVELEKKNENADTSKLLKPDIRSYNTFLLALARAGLYKQATDLLRQLQAPNSAVKPDRISYNTVLLAYALGKPTDESIQCAYGLLMEMLGIEVPDSTGHESNPKKTRRRTAPPPDLITFNTILSIFASYAPSQAEFIFQDLMLAKTNLKPDVYTFTSILYAHAKCGCVGPVYQGLFDMLWRYQVEANAITYTMIVQGFCQANITTEALHLFDTVLEELDKVHECPDMLLQGVPDCVMFSALMDGLVKATPETAYSTCCRLLDKMKQLATKWPETKPNHVTYTTVLTALAKSQLPDKGSRAEQLLTEIKDVTGHPPSLIHYNCALDCHAKSKRPDKAIQAYRLWQRMRRPQQQQQQDDDDDAIVPDIITYNTLLAAASNAFGPNNIKQDSLRVAMVVFDVVRNLSNAEQQSSSSSSSSSTTTSRVQPNSLTYHYLFKTIRRLMPPSQERLTLVQSMLALCCSQGCLNQIIVDQIVQQLAVTAEELQFLLLVDLDPSIAKRAIKRQTLHISSLPETWTAHALQERKKQSPWMSDEWKMQLKRTVTLP